MSNFNYGRLFFFKKDKALSDYKKDVSKKGYL
jgi:hypothetical protein